jgi:hypothetical protein
MTECWAQDPVQRPPSHELERRLQGLDPSEAVSTAWIKSLRLDSGVLVRSAMTK